jgi:hypothetical protein
LTKQGFYDLSHNYRRYWTQLKEHVIPLMNTPLVAFSTLVDTSPHRLDCPKADQMYKLAKLTRSDQTELTRLKQVRQLLDEWIKQLEEAY